MKSKQIHAINNKIKESINQQAIMTASTLPRQCSPRAFKRRQDFKSARQLQSPQRKRNQQISTKKDKFCYINMMSMRKSSVNKQTSLQKKNNKKDNTKKQPKRSSTSPQLKCRTDSKTQITRLKSPKNDLLEPKLLLEKQKKIIDKQVLQITELKQINKILKNQITTLESTKEVQSRIAQQLHQKINHLNFQLRDSQKLRKNHQKQIEKLKEFISKNQIKIQIPQNEQQKKFQKQNLQKIILDINRELDQIFIDDFNVGSKVTNDQKKQQVIADCGISNVSVDENTKKDLYEIVYQLQNKIKYLEIQVAMLKKYKLDYQRMERQWLISNNQLKTFKKKLIILAHQTQNGNPLKKLKNSKVSEDISDSSISLEISKDSNIQRP